MKEAELVAQAKKGDEESFRILVENNMKKIFKLAYQYAGNHHDAEDISQEAFIRAYNSLNSFRGESSFSTWIYRITINCCLNFRRKRGNFREESLDSIIEKYSDGYKQLKNHVRGFNPEKQIFEKEMMYKVGEALECLSNKQKIIFVLKHYQHLSIKEIGKTLGCAEGTIKKQLFRAVTGIRKQLNGII
jgi:RNA polymerase sigma-70 factor (ECF subfamily)